MKTEMKPAPVNGTSNIIEKMASTYDTSNGEVRKNLGELASRKGGIEVITAMQSFLERFGYQGYTATSIIRAVNLISKSITPNGEKLEELKQQPLLLETPEEAKQREADIRTIEKFQVEGHKTLLELIETASLFVDDNKPAKFLTGMGHTVESIDKNTTKDPLLRLSLEEINKKLRDFIKEGRGNLALEIASEFLPIMAKSFVRAKQMIDLMTEVYPPELYPPIPPPLLRTLKEEAPQPNN